MTKGSNDEPPTEGAALQRSVSIPLGVIVQRRPGVSRWSSWIWRAVSVIPGAGAADWRVLRREGEVIEYHAGTLKLELYRSDTEAYLYNLSTACPAIYVIMRRRLGESADQPLDLLAVTASPYEAQDYADNAEDIVEKVDMPESLIAWTGEFVALHHEHETFVKRRRDRHPVDGAPGIGDPRIRQVTDVYRPPRRGRPQ